MDASVSVTTLWQRCADFTVRVVPILWQWPRQIGKHIQLSKYNHQVCIVNTNDVGLKLISFSNFLYVYNYTCIFIFNKWYHLKWRIKKILKSFIYIMNLMPTNIFIQRILHTSNSLYVRVFCDIIWICSDSTFVVFDGSPTPRIYNHNENKFWKS